MTLAMLFIFIGVIFFLFVAAIILTAVFSSKREHRAESYETEELVQIGDVDDLEEAYGDLYKEEDEEQWVKLES